tara:strand:- start:181 stop:345 length:165 start_codon:yes stop_codon:yes gene_type:complete
MQLEALALLDNLEVVQQDLLVQQTEETVEVVLLVKVVDQIQTMLVVLVDLVLWL